MSKKKKENASVCKKFDHEYRVCGIFCFCFEGKEGGGGDGEGEMLCHCVRLLSNCVQIVFKRSVVLSPSQPYPPPIIFSLYASNYVQGSFESFFFSRAQDMSACTAKRAPSICSL